MPTSTAGKRRRANSRAVERGFAYVMVLVATVIIGILAGVANVAVSRTMQAEREQELLFRGMAYRNAIQHYYAATGRYPRSLHELLKGSQLVQHSYLRALYPDPMAEQAGGMKPENGGWRLLRSVDGGISGVSSGSQREPMKKANFPLGLEKFEDAQHYSAWVFDYVPTSATSTNPRGQRIKIVQMENKKAE
jgi:type II secretory pathway pseudopilin PulG